MAIPFIQELGVILFGIFVAVLITGSIILFKKAQRNAEALEKRDIYTISVGLFFLFLAVSYCVRVYFMFFIARTEAEFLLQITATERSVSAMPVAYSTDGRLELLQFLWQVHMATTFIGISFLMFGTEYQIYKKTKYVFTIISFATIPLILFFPYEIAHTIYFASYLSPLAWIFMYIVVAKRATGSVRRNALMLLVGFTIFIVGVLLNSGTLRGLIFSAEGLHVTEFGAIFSTWLSPIVLTIGFVLMIFAFLNKF